MGAGRGPITSGQNARVKLVRALAGRTKERREAGAFLAEGVRLVEEALVSGWPIRFVLHTESLGGRGEALLDRLRASGATTEQVAPRLMASISETENSQGMLAVLEGRELPWAKAMEFVLIADAIRDPGNLGTLLRTGEAAGVDAVILTPGTADAFAPKVVRAGMGAHFRVPIHAMTWEQIGMQMLTQGWKVYLADATGHSCWETNFEAPLAMIIGGEAEGATEPARAAATETVGIPMQGKGESLNAAAAGAVLMFEVARQAAARGPRSTQRRHHHVSPDGHER